MHRFFVSASDIQEDRISLSPDDTSHIRSLRLRPDELFVVCDGQGFDYICMLGDKADAVAAHGEGRNSVDGVRCCAEIFDKFPSQGEPTVKCYVFMAYSKGDRLDYAIQKSVELGAYEIVLFPAARCVSSPHDPEKKLARLQRIALETAKQCNRGIVPSVIATKSFDDAISLACSADLPLFFYELEEGNGLKKVLERAVEEPSSALASSISTVSILTGPEGGFEQYESEAATACGMMSASLGVRILRSDTAPIAALSAIMFFFGEM